MKKFFLPIVLFFGVSFAGLAQSDSTIKKQIFHGVVKNEKNKPIQNASVIVEGDEKGTTTDAEGFFKISARTNANLVITAEGYESSVTPVRQSQVVQLVSTKKRSDSKGSDNIDETLQQQSASNDFRNYSNNESFRVYSGSYLTVFKAKEGTVGSRFLFDKWVNGKLIDKNNNEIVAKGYILNYDKMDGKLLGVNDQKTIIEIDDTALSGYSFENPSGGEILFKKIKIADKDKFVIVLLDKVNRYSLYKSLKTEFIKADYSNNGLIQSGHKYDEYVDKFEYYIHVPGSNDLTKIEFKEKAIRKVLANDEAKVKTFFSSHTEGKIDEDMLTQLISFLNQD